MTKNQTAPCIDCGEDMTRGENLWECAACGETRTDADVREEAREREADNRAWRQEIAREAGMLHGCDGFNEVMGY
jgi:hypothetical protein